MNPSTLIVFGGSFNPPHIAHLAVAEVAADFVRNSKILWMPAATPPHKQEDSDLASAVDRLAMVRLAIEGNERFEVSDLEIQRGDVSFTVETLRALKKEHSETELALLLGGDSLAQFQTWREPEAISEMARLLVYRRPGFERTAVSEGVLEHVAFLDAPLLELSSTVLRDRLRTKMSARYLIPDAVLAYVEEHGLYRSFGRRSS